MKTGHQQAHVRYVYVAGPLSHGTVMHNVNVAVKWSERLWDAGFVPYVPHLSVLYDMIVPKHYVDWMEYCLAWVGRCDAVSRLPGESFGADREVAEAERLGIPVYEGTNSGLWQMILDRDRDQKGAASDGR